MSEIFAEVCIRNGSGFDCNTFSQCVIFQPMGSVFQYEYGIPFPTSHQDIIEIVESINRQDKTSKIKFQYAFLYSPEETQRIILYKCTSNEFDIFCQKLREFQNLIEKFPNRYQIFLEQISAFLSKKVDSEATNNIGTVLKDVPESVLNALYFFIKPPQDAFANKASTILI